MTALAAIYVCLGVYGLVRMVADLLWTRGRR